MFDETDIFISPLKLCILLSTLTLGCWRHLKRNGTWTWVFLTELLLHYLWSDKYKCEKM